MDWPSQNWAWILIGTVFSGAHWFGHGHGGHGGHGASGRGHRGCGGGSGAKETEKAPAREPSSHRH